MNCTDLREKRSARCVASRTMHSRPMWCCVAMAAQESAFPPVRASRCRDATFMAVRPPATFMRQLENSSPNLRASRVNEKRGLQKHSSIRDGARLPPNGPYRRIRKTCCLSHQILGDDLALTKVVRKCEYSPFDAKAPLQLRLYPSVEGFGYENISSAGTPATRAMGWLSLVVTRWFQIAGRALDSDNELIRCAAFSSLIGYIAKSYRFILF